MKIRIKKSSIYMAIFWILFALFIGGVVFAEENEATIQDINNEKTNVGINLNSQIREDGKAKKQGIKNVHSNCNININRNTYKFYYIDNTEK